MNSPWNVRMKRDNSTSFSHDVSSDEPQTLLLLKHKRFLSLKRINSVGSSFLSISGFNACQRCRNHQNCIWIDVEAFFSFYENLSSSRVGNNLNRMFMFREFKTKKCKSSWPCSTLFTFPDVENQISCVDLWIPHTRENRHLNCFSLRQPSNTVLAFYSKAAEKLKIFRSCR